MCPRLNKDIVDIQYHFKSQKDDSGNIKFGEITLGDKTIEIGPKTSSIILQRYVDTGKPKTPVKLYVKNGYGSSNSYDITQGEFKTYLMYLTRSPLLCLEKRDVNRYNC